MYKNFSSSSFRHLIGMLAIKYFYFFLLSYQSHRFILFHIFCVSLCNFIISFYSSRFIQLAIRGWWDVCAHGEHGLLYVCKNVKGLSINNPFFHTQTNPKRTFFMFNDNNYSDNNNNHTYVNLPTSKNRQLSSQNQSIKSFSLLVE